jgi:hypothetical protein
VHWRVDHHLAHRPQGILGSKERPDELVPIFWNALYAGINASTAAYVWSRPASTPRRLHGLLHLARPPRRRGAYAFAIPIVTYDWWYWSLLVFVAHHAPLPFGIPRCACVRLPGHRTIAAAEIIRYLCQHEVHVAHRRDRRQSKGGRLCSDHNPWPNDARYHLGAQVLSGYRVHDGAGV